MPYVAVGPAYKGQGGTETYFGSAVVVVQVDCFASSKGGGAAKVGEMAQAVATALSTEITVSIDGDTPQVITTVEDDVLNPSLQDAFDGPVYAQRYVRFRFTVGEPTTFPRPHPQRYGTRPRLRARDRRHRRRQDHVHLAYALARVDRNEQLRQPRQRREHRRHGLAELSMETLYVYGDTGQAAIEAAFADNDAAAAVVLTSADDTAGVFEYAGSLWITELELQMEMNEVVKYSISGTFTGA